MSFSERFGLQQPKVLVQADSMDEDLRTALWNAMWASLWERDDTGPGTYLYQTIFTRMWIGLWKQPLDRLPNWGGYWDHLRSTFFTGDWNRVYDVIDFIAQFSTESDYLDNFVTVMNIALEHERSAFRLVGGRLQRLTGPEEIAAVEQAASDAQDVPGARRHLNRAAELLADRTARDYRNSIKESISAVEAVCEQLSGKKGTLGDCLKHLETPAALHPALKGAFQKLYGYTSDAQGIRHALSDEPTLDHADAMYMLVACSAFVSYLLGKAASGRSDEEGSA